MVSSIFASNIVNRLTGIDLLSYIRLPVGIFWIPSLDEICACCPYHPIGLVVRCLYQVFSRPVLPMVSSYLHVVRKIVDYSVETLTLMVSGRLLFYLNRIILCVGFAAGGHRPGNPCQFVSKRHCCLVFAASLD